MQSSSSWVSGLGRKGPGRGRERDQGPFFRHLCTSALCPSAHLRHSVACFALLSQHRQSLGLLCPAPQAGSLPSTMSDKPESSGEWRELGDSPSAQTPFLIKIPKFSEVIGSEWGGKMVGLTEGRLDPLPAPSWGPQLTRVPGQTQEPHPLPRRTGITVRPLPRAQGQGGIPTSSPAPSGLEPRCPVWRGCCY